MTPAARVLRSARHAAELTQAQLAASAGVSQSIVSEVEKGVRSPTVAMLERLLAAAGCRLEMTTAPLWELVDAAIDRAAAVPLDERIGYLDVDIVRVERLWSPDFAHVWVGSGAALLHGVPVERPRWELLTTRVDDPALWIPFMADHITVYTGPEPHQVELFGVGDPLPVTGTDRLPDAVPIPAAGTVFPVAALHEIEVADPDVARILARLRSRLASQA